MTHITPSRIRLRPFPVNIDKTSNGARDTVRAMGSRINRKGIISNRADNRESRGEIFLSQNESLFIACPRGPESETRRNE